MEAAKQRGGGIEAPRHNVQQEQEADDLLLGGRVMDRFYRENQISNFGGFDWLTWAALRAGDKPAE